MSFRIIYFIITKKRFNYEKNNEKICNLLQKCQIEVATSDITLYNDSAGMFDNLCCAIG